MNSLVNRVIIFAVAIFLVCINSYVIARASEPEEISNRNLFTELRNQNVEQADPNKRANFAEPCNCTSLFQCDLDMGKSKTEAGAITDEEEEDGADIEVIDIRNQFGSSSSPSSPTFPCKHYLEICCNHYQRHSIPEVKSKTPHINMQQCGRRNVNGVGFRIVGNIEGESQMGEFPWMVAITEINKKKDRAEYVCGGSLIHPRVVLTTAHHMAKKFAENLNVRVGEWDTQTDREDPYVHHDREVDQIIIHENYQTSKVLKNDIALLILSKEVPLARHIGTVCLSSNFKPGGQRCFASGWGKNLYGKEGSYQNILKKVDLPVIPSDVCQTTMRSTNLGRNFRLHESFICAGGEKGKDTCKGDGGSPLVCQIPGTDYYQQVGSVSWGLGCGEQGVPGVYTNIPLFVPWIEAKFKELNFNTSYFKV